MGHLIILLLRYLSSFLDGIAYWLVIKIYNLLYEIAGATLFLSTIDSIGKNIYAILGVVMLFKLAFSLITYIINPDQFTSSDKGFTAVIKNCFIVVILILIVPLIFEQAMKLQRVILEEDIVGRVITGKDKSGTNNTIDESVGYNMAFNLISGFIRPNDELFPNCKNVMNSSATSFQECMADFNESYGEASTTYKTAIENADYKLLLDSNIIASEDGDGRFLFDYTFFITTAVGGFTAYILLMFCIDVAVRSVKLAFLQLIAPIPIVSYVDPKGQKGIFNKWVNVCTSTYLDLFIRLAAIYFVVYVIQNLFVSGGITTLTGEEPSIFVIIFMILGSLLFAKQVPQLISDITGIKLDGKFTLNPMKKASEVPLLGAPLASGMAVGGAGLLAGGRLLTGGGRALGQLMTGQSEKAGAQWSATRARASARMKAGLTAGHNNLTNLSNYTGSGKYEASGAGYKSMMRGKDSVVNALGEQLFSKYYNSYKSANDAKDYKNLYNGIIKNDEMRQVASNLTAAKDRRNKLQSDYEQMQLRLNNGDTSINAADVDAARIAYTKASSDYDKINAEFTRQKGLNSKDAERYDAFMKQVDAVEAQEHVNNYYSSSSSTTPNSSGSSNTSSSNSSSSRTSTTSTNNPQTPFDTDHMDG